MLPPYAGTDGRETPQPAGALDQRWCRCQIRHHEVEIEVEGGFNDLRSDHDHPAVAPVLSRDFLQLTGDLAAMPGSHSRMQHNHLVPGLRQPSADVQRSSNLVHNHRDARIRRLLAVFQYPLHVGVD